MFQQNAGREPMDRVHMYMVQDYVEAYLTLREYSMRSVYDEQELSEAVRALNTVSEQMLSFKKERGLHSGLLNLDGFVRPDGTMNMFTLARYRANRGFKEFDMEEIEEAYNYASYFLQKKEREGKKI